MKKFLFLAISLLFQAVAVENKVEMVKFPERSLHAALLTAEDQRPCLVDPSCTVPQPELGKAEEMVCEIPPAQVFERCLSHREKIVA